MKVDTFTLMRGIRASSLSRVAKSLGWAIALRCGNRRACSASVGKLGRDTGYKPSAVRGGLKELCDAGLLVRTERPSQTTLLELRAEPLAALAAQESAEAAARKIEREQTRRLTHSNVKPLRIPDPTPAAAEVQPRSNRGTPLRNLETTPPESGAEIPIQIPKEKQRGNTTTKTESAAAVASLIVFGMNEKAADEVAPQMVPGEAERAISWAKSNDKGAGLIVNRIRNGQRPWNIAEDATPQIDEARMRALLAEEGGTDETR